MRKTLLVLLILILVSTCGCWGRVETNQAVIIMGAGWDRLRNQQIQVTMQMASMQKEERSRTFITASALGDTISMARRNLTLSIPREQFHHHTSVHVLGENMAQHLVDTVDLLVRSEVIRRNRYIFIARGTTAQEILKVPMPIEKYPAQGLVSMIKSQTPQIGLYNKVTINEVLGKLAAPGIEPVIPGVEIIEDKPGGKTLRLAGLAVFKKGRLIGWLNENESRGYRWLRPEGFAGGTITIADSNGKPVVLEVIRGQGRIKPEIAGDGKIIIHATIREELTFLEQRDIQELLLPETIKILEQIISQQVEIEVMAAIRKARELDSDIFGFGLAISRTQPQEWKQLEQNWEKLFPAVELKVHAVCKIRRSNLLAKVLRSD